MASIINADVTNGVVITSDTSGEIQLQANGVTKAKVTANGLQDANGNSLRGGSFRNLIINGDMRIDQRNAGASVTPNNTYTVDRFWVQNSQTSKLTAQQNAGSVTPPTGFINYLGITSSSSYSVLTGDYFNLQQSIEGLNCADLAWGTANAVTVTLSFRVYSSLTGTFGGSLRNSAYNRSYPFTYTISSANTWTTISLTIAGDTTGTWLTTNGIGINVLFSLGTGATYSGGTANAWNAGNYNTPSGTVSVVGTSGATFYITGVQLEVGEGASDFEHLPYDVQLQRCQRYFEIMGSSGSTNNAYAVCAVITSTNTQGVIWFKTEKRATPTITATGTWYSLPQSITASPSFQIGDTFNAVIIQVWSGLTVGQASYLYDGGIGTSRILISAEL
jgi:hypothetical protein